MNANIQTNKMLRVFDVARELKLETPKIIEHLESRGFDMPRQGMQPVTEEMYADILFKFDRAKFQRYQTEHTTTKEQEQKRDSDRLRQEELDKILAAKRKEKVQAAPKIELPKPPEFIQREAPETKVAEEVAAPSIVPVSELTPAPAIEPSEAAPITLEPKELKAEPAVEAPPVTVEPPPGGEIEPTSTAVGAESPAVAMAEPAITIPLAETLAVSPPQIAEPIAEAPSQPEAEVDYGVQSQLDAVMPRRKIELPKPVTLRIVEQAPPKKEEKAPAKPERPPRKEAKAPPAKEAKAPPDKEAKPAPKEVTGAPEAEKPKRKKLKRKRLKAKLETPEDLIEIKADADLRKEREKQVKTKPGAVKEEPSPSGRKRRRRKAKAPAETAKAKPVVAERPPRPKKRRKVSESEVAASIRETMAKIEGRGKVRRKHTHAPEAALEPEGPAKLQVTEFLTTQELSALMEIPFQDVIKRCLEMGMVVSINQRLDRDVIELLAAEFGFDVEFVEEEEIEEIQSVEQSDNLVKRPPVVTVMGHVDHGKTTLLDFLRRTKVAEGEAGGITQHIGAYEVNYGEERITFLDTPGHEAFTAMRARGAQITDIVVLVVAADDRVMPQTIEAIDHARAASTPIVVAVNKIDKPAANKDSIYKQLADQGVLVEKWGGKYQSAEISAKFGQGLDDLLSEILVSAEMLDLKADASQRARGVVVESRLDKGLGAVATILIQSGTLRVSDNFVVGQFNGRVRAMYNERGEERFEAGPATPVQVVGFNGVPQAGDKLQVFTLEKEAREVSQRRQRQAREMSMRQIHALSLESVSRRMKEEMLQELPLIIKGDVHGSVEVLSDSLMKLSTSEVKVHIIRRGVGAITESDVLLAAASGAIIVGFHVHPNLQAKELARREGVDIRLYRILYEVVNQVKQSLEGLLTPLQEEHVIGNVEVRQTFKISRIGMVAGCYVLDGKVVRNNKVRLIRDGIELWSGELSSLKRFKDDAREVSAGFECGLSLENYRDLRIGDLIQVYEIVETARRLEEG